MLDKKETFSPGRTFCRHSNPKPKHETSGGAEARQAAAETAQAAGGSSALLLWRWKVPAGARRRSLGLSPSAGHLDLEENSLVIISPASSKLSTSNIFSIRKHAMKFQ
jgi:hypothetical protein